jgi:hypothetical protein
LIPFTHREVLPKVLLALRFDHSEGPRDTELPCSGVAGPVPGRIDTAACGGCTSAGVAAIASAIACSATRHFGSLSGPTLTLTPANGSMKAKCFADCQRVEAHL